MPRASKKTGPDYNRLLRREWTTPEIVATSELLAGLTEQFWIICQTYLPYTPAAPVAQRPRKEGGNRKGRAPKARFGFRIPDGWSREQASTVCDLLDDLTLRIRGRYLTRRRKPTRPRPATQEELPF